MSQGIVRATPRPGSAIADGKVEVNKAEPDKNIYVGQTFSFSDPGFTVQLQSIVEFTITTAQFCTVTKILQPPPPKHHGHNAPPVPTQE